MVRRATFQELSQIAKKMSVLPYRISRKLAKVQKIKCEKTPEYQELSQITKKMSALLYRISRKLAEI
jgi:hypothetical protein